MKLFLFLADGGLIINKLKVFFKLHNHLNLDLLTNICLLKDKNWFYGLENQLDWIQNNIEVEDIHVLGYINDKLDAYANLVRRKILINDDFEMTILGIGNVCVADKGLGMGKFLMEEINNFLLRTKFAGILLCKNRYVNFYINNNWYLLDNTILDTDFKTDIVNVMVFNLQEKINLKSLKIIGKSF